MNEVFHHKMILRNILKNANYLKPRRFASKSGTAPQILNQWKEKFQAAEVDSPEFCLKSIVAHVLKTKVSQLPDLETIHLTNEEIVSIETFCQCRVARMPLQYILGEWDFLDFTLKITPPVFIPRPETEGLIQLILQRLNNYEAYEFLEVGCGTGAISLSLLRALHKSTSTAVDCSKSACKLTRENADRLGLDNRIEVFEHRVSDKSLLPSNVQKVFDFIVSNPPYIKTDELPNLAPEVFGLRGRSLTARNFRIQLNIEEYENVVALNGGPDGLKVVRDICQIACNQLKPNGYLWMEVDSSHPAEIEKEIATQFGEALRFNGSLKDIFGNLRFVEIIKN